MDKIFYSKKSRNKLALDEKESMFNFFEETFNEYNDSDTKISKFKKSKFNKDYELEIKETYNLFNEASNKAADIFQKNIQIKNELELYIFDINLEKEHINKDKNIIVKQFELLRKMQFDIEKDKKEFNNFQANEYESIKTFRETEIERIQKFKIQVDQKEERLDREKREFEILKRELASEKLNFETEKMEFADRVSTFDQIVKDFNRGISKLPDENSTF